MQDLKLSKVSLPITINLKEIETTINEQIDRVLFENKNLNDDGDHDFEIRAEKPEDISVVFESSHIRYRVPLKIWIKKVVPIVLLEVEVEGAIAMSLSTEFKIEKDWKLTTVTRVIEHEWLEKPQIRIGLFDLPIKFILNTVLEKSEKYLSKSLDKALAKHFDLQKIAQKAWKQIQAPIQVDEELGIWLIIRPEKVGMTPLMSDGEHLKGTIMVQTYAAAVIGEKPTSINEDPVPSFHLSTEIKDDFDLYLKNHIDYAQAGKIARKYVIEQSITKSIFSIKIVDLKLSGKGDKVVIETKISGSFNGEIVFEGKPVFDKMKYKIKIEQPDYKLVTQNILFRFINWVLKRLIKNRLRKLLSFPLKEDINKLILRIGNLLTNYEVVDNVILNGNLEKLDIENIQFEENGLNLTISSAGELNIHVNKIEIKKEPENQNI